jgi:DNA-binding NtrC family response regulator
MSGWEVYQKIQAQADLQKIPLVVMSGRKEEVTEKLPEPFEYFEFLGKPFDQKQLMGAIKSAIGKSKLTRKDIAPPLATPTPELVAATRGVNVIDSSAEIKALNDKITKMQAEIEGLKKQLNQVVTFIKQKIK